MKSTISSAIDSSKRACVLCHTYRNLKPSNDQKQMAMVSTKRAYDTLTQAFDELRKSNSPLSQLDTIRAAKILCLDAIDSCECCDRQRPRMKEILADIK